ncbi:uncharacterized protein LOC143265184 [Megachile rotundata]|uniref:uncharacterized protein LOC143265184 n=1 Tax=Megachile rotundata TaxID=143995 RepID=UPI003FD0150D
MCRATFISLFFFKLIGLATFSIITVKKTKQYKKKTIFFIYNKLGICYNIILSCLVIGSTYITLPIIYNAEYFNKTTITTSIEILHGVLGNIVIGVTLFCYCCNQLAFVKFGNHLINILEELRRLREPVNRKRIVSVLTLIYFFELILLLVLTISDYLTFNSKFGYWLVNILPSSFVNWLFIQYYAVLLVMHAIFVNMNKIIENTFLSRTDDVQVNYLHRSCRVFIDSVKIQSLMQLRNIHGHLCNISVQVSHFYSLPILLGTSLKFVVSLYNSYYLFEPFLAKNMTVEPGIIINTLLWLIYLLYPIGLLTTKVTTVINEVRRIKELRSTDSSRHRC